MAKRSTKKKQPDNVNPTAHSVGSNIKEAMARVPALLRRSQQPSVDFLKVELELGLTFAAVARTSADPLHRERARARALQAYNTLLEQLPKLETALDDKQGIEGKLKQLEQALKQLSEGSPKGA